MEKTFLSRWYTCFFMHCNGHDSCEAGLNDCSGAPKIFLYQTIDVIDFVIFTHIRIPYYFHFKQGTVRPNNNIDRRRVNKYICNEISILHIRIRYFPFKMIHFLTFA